jgi:hypothetical protein
VLAGKQLPVRVYDAEAVALGISQDHVVSVWRSFAPMHLGGAQGDQMLDLSGLVVCVQVTKPNKMLGSGKMAPLL